MNAELKEYKNALTEITEKLFLIDPNAVGDSAIISVCDYFKQQGKVREAEDLSDRFLEYFPENLMVRYYREVLSEPNEISGERRNEIALKVRMSITDPIGRAVSLGLHYRENGEFEKSEEQYKKVVEPYC